MKDEIEISTNNSAELKSLIYLLYANDYKYHGTVESPDNAYNSFQGYSNLRVRQSDRYICGYNYSKIGMLDFTEDIDQIMGFIIPKDVRIIVEDVGDYTATISKKGIEVGCQTISHEKFKEIMEAVKSLNQ